MDEEEIFRLILTDVVYELVVRIMWELPQITHLQDVSSAYSMIPDAPTLQKQTKCPRCQRSIAVARFASHLEKCLGMGRQAAAKPLHPHHHHR